MATKEYQNLIVKMTSKDVAFGQRLIDCRYAPLDMLSEKRAKQWMRSGYIKKIPVMEGKDGKQSVPYGEITKRGWDHLQRCTEIETTRKYNSKKDAKPHDVCVGKEWDKAKAAGKVWYNGTVSQTMLEERKEYLISVGRKDEADRIQHMQIQGLISAPDAITFDPSTGEYEVIEIITRNYDDDDVEAKREWARCMGIRDDFDPIEMY